jgi:hypothetical protein
MAKKEIKQSICSFCLAQHPHNEFYTVELPMHRLPNGETRGVYRTPCCEKCIDKKTTKERIFGISEEPKAKKKS